MPQIPTLAHTEHTHKLLFSCSLFYALLSIRLSRGLFLAFWNFLQRKGGEQGYCEDLSAQMSVDRGQALVALARGKDSVVNGFRERGQEAGSGVEVGCRGVRGGKSSGGAEGHQAHPRSLMAKAEGLPPSGKRLLALPSLQDGSIKVWGRRLLNMCSTPWLLCKMVQELEGAEKRRPHAFSCGWIWGKCQRSRALPSRQPESALETRPPNLSPRTLW